MKKPNKIPLKAIALLLGVFLLGMICGAGLLVMNVKKTMQKMVHAKEPPAKVTKAFSKAGQTLSKKLQLSPTETAAVEKEMIATMENLSAIRRKTLDSLAREANESTDRIAAQIPAEKHDQLRAMAKKRLGPWGLLPPVPES